MAVPKTLIRYNAVYLLAALFLPDGVLAFLFGTGMPLGAFFYYPLLPAAFAGAGACAVLFLKARRSPAAESEAQEEEKPVSVPREVRRRPVIQKDVVDFFFSVFSQQVGETTASEVALLESRKEHFTHVYEFTTTQKGKKYNRRMTISSIGEDAGARSRCFYVIYNAHLVVKIPPTPITDYSQYIREIQREREMVKTLAPLECVVPKVSVILRWLFPENAPERFTEAELEDRYIQYAGMNPRVQTHLKIGDGFAFFMDLSTRFFLSNVLADLRNVGDRTTTELSACPDIVRDTSAFSGRYPGAAMDVCFDLQKVYKAFEEGARGIAADVGYRLPDFFMRTLAGNRPGPKEMGLAPEAHAAICEICEKTLAENAPAVAAYRTSVEEHINTVVLSQNRPKIQALIANCVKLLAFLGQKKVAARDLKPDNLFITGDPAHYPAFLTDPGRFSLGLIDLETSLGYARTSGRIPQPPLAGTPLYATQTHLFDNELITELLGDLELVLSLQDWYAVTGICYLIVTGEPLFQRSARALAGATKIMATPQATHDDPLHFAKEASRLFWQTASAEFTENMRRNKKSLASVSVLLDKGVAAYLAPHFTSVLAELDAEFGEKASTQTVFTDEKSRRVLAGATYEKLLLQRRKLENDSGPEKAGRAMALLGELAEIKRRAAAYEQALAVLTGPEASLEAGTLLTCLFHRVERAMFKKDWGEV